MYSFNGPVYPNLFNVDIADPKLPTPRMKDECTPLEWNNSLTVKEISVLYYISTPYFLLMSHAEHSSSHKLQPTASTVTQYKPVYILHPEKQQENKTR